MSEKVEDKIKKRIETKRKEFKMIVELMRDVPMYDDREKYLDS